MSKIRQLMTDLYSEAYVFTVYLYPNKQTTKGTVQLLTVRQKKNKASKSKALFFHTEMFAQSKARIFPFQIAKYGHFTVHILSLISF